MRRRNIFSEKMFPIRISFGERKRANKATKQNAMQITGWMDATTLFRHKICARKVGSDLLFDPSFCSSLDGKIISIARDRTRGPLL